MSDRQTRRFARVAFIAVLGVAATVQAGASADDFWQFYERYPHMQEFFPFGIYGGACGRWSSFGLDPKHYNEMRLEVMAEAGINAIWGTATRRNVRYDKDGHLLGLNEFGEWFYGEALPFYELKCLPSFTNMGTRYSVGVLANYARNEPLLNAEELRTVEAGLKEVLGFAHALAANHPKHVVGFVSDDEPSYLAPAMAAIRLLEKRTGRPVTTCIPSWGAFKMFAANMQPITGDWYVTSDTGRNSWAVAERMRWVRDHHPDRVVYFIPLGGAFYGGHETTKPWLRDARPSATEFRAQVWMALAGGCKGIFTYHLGSWPHWAGGEDPLLNPLLKPNSGAWGEHRRFGRFLPSVGPLLLSCRPDPTAKPQVACGTVRYPAFEGPAVDLGVLKDVRHERYILIPWNNNVDRKESGTIRLPRDLLPGAQLLDLVRLEPVVLNAERAFSLSLAPGDGRILLLAGETEVAACRETILRNRVRHPRVMARIAAQQCATPGVGAGLMEEARKAEVAEDWTRAAELYGAARAAVAEADKTVRGVTPARAALQRLAGVLSESDDQLRCHRHLFGIPPKQHMHWSHFPNKAIGRPMRDWVSLATLYFEVWQRARERRFRDFCLHDTLRTMSDWAKRNRAEIDAAIQKRLAEVRKPIRVALITDNRDEIEYHKLCSWLYENATATWLAPNGKGGLTAPKGRAFQPADYDAIWIHQLAYTTPVADQERPEPAKVLAPEFVAPATVDALRAAVRDQGRGLVLTGVAGLLATTLGVESTPPNKVRENTYFRQGVALGLAVAPGCEKHPLFDGLAAKGFFTNFNFPGQNLFTEVAWEKVSPAGQVVANEFDQLFGRIAEYAAVVEYRLGKGVVLVLGGRSCDYTPGNPHGLGEDNLRADLRRRLRRATLNALVYVAQTRRFEPDASAVAAAKPAGLAPVSLPTAGWLFKTDPDNVGLVQSWFGKDMDTTGWKPIRIGTNWESQGFDHDGYAWYRCTVELANRPGLRTMLHFGAVDEQALVFLDGKRVGEHNQGLLGWDQPFALDITDFLAAGPKQYLLAVQVFDHHAAGGIWKPVFLRYEQKP